MTLTETQKAYIAGLIDGEGTVVVGKVKHNGRFSPKIAIEMTDSIAIKWIHNLTGIGSIAFRKRRTMPTAKPVHRWVVTSSEATNLLELVLPYLLTKQKQAELFIEIGKIRKSHRGGRASPNFTRQTEIYLLMKDLNKRGA